MMSINYLVHLLGSFIEDAQKAKVAESMSDTEIERIAQAVVQNMRLNGMTMAVVPESDKTERKIYDLQETNETGSEIEISDDLLDFAIG